MAESTLLEYLYFEKWLDIQGFTNVTDAHFVTKCHIVISSQNSISTACTWDSILSVITDDSWRQLRFRTKTYLKTDSFAVFENSRFVNTDP